MKTYGCIGEVRGDCGHKHRKLTGAVRCLLEDKIGCKSQGGYSDRIIYERCPGPGGFDFASLDRDDHYEVYGIDGLLDSRR